VSGQLHSLRNHGRCWWRSEWALMIGVYDRAQLQSVYSSVHTSLRGCTTAETTAL